MAISDFLARELRVERLICITEVFLARAHLTFDFLDPFRTNGTTIMN